MKFDLLDHLTEASGRFQSMALLDASPFVRQIMHVQCVYRDTSQCLASNMDDMLGIE